MLIPPVHTALPSNTNLVLVLPWAITTSGPPFHGVAAAPPHLPLRYGLLPVRSPLLGKSKFVSSPALIDMLKFRAFLVVPHSFRTHAVLRAYRVRHAVPHGRSPYIPYTRSSAANNPSAGSPTETLLRLTSYLLFIIQNRGSSS